MISCHFSSLLFVIFLAFPPSPFVLVLASIGHHRHIPWTCENKKKKARNCSARLAPIRQTASVTSAPTFSDENIFPPVQCFLPFHRFNSIRLKKWFVPVLFWLLFCHRYDCAYCGCRGSRGLLPFVLL